MNYLLDTCVISEYIKKQPNKQVIEWLDAQPETSLFLSILTIAELKKGIIKLKKSEPNRCQKLTQWLKTIEKRFNTRILPLSDNILYIWAEICGEYEAKGQKLPFIDSLILATAYHHQLIIVTRNIRDFNFPELQVFSPWDLTNN